MNKMVSNISSISSKGSYNLEKIAAIVGKEISELMRSEIADDESEMSILRELHNVLSVVYLMDVSIYRRMSNLSNMTTCDGAPFLVIETRKRQQAALDFDNTVCVDLNFKQQYKLGRPTNTYSEFFEGLPNIFIGSYTLMNSTVDIACNFMKQSFTDRDMYIPPWRTALCIKSSYHFIDNKSVRKVEVPIVMSSDSESSSD